MNNIVIISKENTPDNIGTKEQENDQNMICG